MQNDPIKYPNRRPWDEIYDGERKFAAVLSSTRSPKEPCRFHGKQPIDQSQQLNPIYKALRVSHLFISEFNTQPFPILPHGEGGSVPVAVFPRISCIRYDWFFLGRVFPSRENYREEHERYISRARPITGHSGIARIIRCASTCTCRALVTATTPLIAAQTGLWSLLSMLMTKEVRSRRGP